jgi:hypothetical protein
VGRGVTATFEIPVGVVPASVPVSTVAIDDDALLARLAAVPAPAIARFERALAHLDVAAIADAIETIDEHDADAAGRLRVMTENYQYAQLLRLISAMHAEDAT